MRKAIVYYRIEEKEALEKELVAVVPMSIFHIRKKSSLKKYR
jgi:hypothetical protein